jgi:pimeloyl-ACP methyl ester carboxylesterase
MIISSPFESQLGRIPVRELSSVVLGSTTRSWDYGDADAATTIVMVHGFRGDHHGLEPVVAQLGVPGRFDGTGATGGIRMISPDLPGFGQSDPLHGIRHDIEGYARWLRAFVAGLALTGRVVILGHSFGSIVVAAALAEPALADTALTEPSLAANPAAGNSTDKALHPDAVILVNPIAAPALRGPRGILTRLAVFYYWLSAVLPERLGFALLRNRVIVRVMSVTMAKTTDKGLRRWIHNQHDRYFSSFSDRRVVLEAFRASVGNDVSEFAGRIPERTLLVAAEKDDITPVAAQEKLVTLFPDATLHVIPAVGHLIHYEVPAQAAEQIVRFLERSAR